MVILKQRMTIGPKGQVVIPIYFRKKYKIFPGDEVIIEETENGILLEKPSIDIVKLAEELAKKIKYQGPIDTKKGHYEQIEKRLRRAGL